MKRIIISLISASVVLAACSRLESSPVVRDGVLSLSSLTVNCDTAVLTRAYASAEDYFLFISDAAGRQVWSGSYDSAVAADTLTLPQGDYVLGARSTMEEVPDAVFGLPVYGAEQEFTIVAGQTTCPDRLVCTLLQAKATVSYDEEFLKCVTGDGSARVCINPSYPLEYPLYYNGGVVAYDNSEGYFKVNNDLNTTMNVTFSGMIDGRRQTMTANLTGIQPRQWCQIRFIRKVDNQGTASFSITIDDYISDSELSVPLTVQSEPVIGEDPLAPKGDGGIRIELAPDCTQFSDLSDINVPGIDKGMDLRLHITVPDGVASMIVNMESTNVSFLDAVELAGGTTLNLLDPKEEQDIVFQIVPFPHGNDLKGKTSIDFDLSAAQEPILAFPGEHTFTIKIMDSRGCSKSVAVTLKVR